MLKTIKVNLEEIETMLYFWHSTKDREKVSEVYLNEIANTPGLMASYDTDFTKESVRKVLSAITNRERLSSITKAEGRFWNNNMWMLEDLAYTDAMAKPVKQLNLDDIIAPLNEQVRDCTTELVEVRFSPLSLPEYIINGNMLVINFFNVKPSDGNDDAEARIGECDIKLYCKEKIKELLVKQQ